MYYIKLDEMLNITYVSSKENVPDKYNLIFYDDDLYSLLITAGFDRFKLNKKALLKDMISTDTLRSLFNKLDNNFEHLLIYLDFNGDRTRLNDVIKGIVQNNCIQNISYLINRGKLFYLDNKIQYINLDNLETLKTTFNKELLKSKIESYNSEIIDYASSFYVECVSLLDSVKNSDDLLKVSNKFIFKYKY